MERIVATNTERVTVKKTWKLYLGGAFVRSESGRYLTTDDGEHYCHASRKDVRDAVSAALKAQPGWAARTAYNRGQILYRLAEVLETRRCELLASLTRGGAQSAAAEREVDAAIDRVVGYAGWADKLAAVLSTSNPVAGPHFGFTVVEPTTIVGVVAPLRPALLGLVGCICPIIVSGNAVVVAPSDEDPRTAVTLAEALATCDLPGGVVNLLTGESQATGSVLAKHQGVRALDLWNLPDDVARELELSAADNVKRVSRRSLTEEQWYDDQTLSPGWISRFVEHKAIWHPVGV